MRQASAQGPSRLRHTLQLAVDPLLGHPALQLCPGSADLFAMWVWSRRPQSHHMHQETHRALQPRQPRFTLPISTLDPAFLPTCRLLAGTDRPAQPAHPQQPHTARAPAGRHSPTGSRGFRPLNHRPPPLLHSSRAPRDPAGSAVPADALRSPSTAAHPCISTREAPRKSATRRRSPPPTP